MYYHVRATIQTNDTTELQTYIDQFYQKAERQKKLAFVRKFNYTTVANRGDGKPSVFVEAWLDMSLVNERLEIFEKLKQFVASKGGGTVDWHECSHDAENRKPCMIAESYTIGG